MFWSWTQIRAMIECSWRRFIITPSHKCRVQHLFLWWVIGEMNTPCQDQYQQRRMIAYIFFCSIGLSWCCPYSTGKIIIRNFKSLSLSLSLGWLPKLVIFLVEMLKQQQLLLERRSFRGYFQSRAICSLTCVFRKRLTKLNDDVVERRSRWTADWTAVFPV